MMKRGTSRDGCILTLRLAPLPFAPLLPEPLSCELDDNRSEFF